jgi:hypothetical protein
MALLGLAPIMPSTFFKMGYIASAVPLSVNGYKFTREFITCLLIKIRNLIPTAAFTSLKYGNTETFSEDN